MEDILLRVVIGILGSLAIGGLLYLVGRVSGRIRRRPHRARAHPERLRMPRFMLWIGIFVVALMGLVIVAAFTTADPDPMMKVIPGLMLLVGVFLILTYANWYLVVREDHLVFRDFLRRVREVWYRDIVRYAWGGNANSPTLTVWTEHGTKFTVNPRAYDVTPLLRSLPGHPPGPGHRPGPEAGPNPYRTEG